MNTGGDRTMTGRIRGLVTQLERQLGRGIFRAWCGPHQLDHMIQAVYGSAFDEFFLSLLKMPIRYLRRYQNIRSDVRSECPKFCSVRWLSKENV